MNTILNLLNLFILFNYFIRFTIQNCHPLNLQDGQLICTRPNSGQVTTCEETQEIGTIATYKCNLHYTYYDTKHSTYTNTIYTSGSRSKRSHELKCGQDSKWIGYKKFDSIGCKEDCGSRLTNAKPLIINGVSTNVSLWPWHAAIFKKAGNSFHYICGGTIIKRSAILTAAHCVTVSSSVKLQPDSYIVVLAAQSHIFDDNKNLPETQTFGVTKMFVSASYDARKEFQADIAIIQLNGTIEYSDTASPVCLPNDVVADLNAVKPGKLGDVVGFGVDEDQELSSSLKHAKLEIKSHSECYVQLERTLTESQFCAGSIRDEKWVTVCNGDSGGGLVQPSVIQEKYFIHGIVSTGDSKVRVGVCQNEAVFTRVFSFIGWIQNVLEQIGESLALEFNSNFGIPYVLKGKENLRVEFIPIPVEWKNRVSSIELTNVEIDPEVLLDSLEYCKTIQQINFTRINLKKAFSRRRVRLPHLKSVSMDILREDLNISESRTWPLALSNNFISSLIFFDQDIEDDSVDFRYRIAKLKTDTQITVHIFKLLDISQDAGRLSISQSSLANDFLIHRLKSGGSDNFVLKHLALNRCSLNRTALNILSRQYTTQTLVLDQVELTGQNDISFLLKRLNRLQEFVFEAPFGHYNVMINAHEIPNGLGHLALSGAKLDFSSRRTRILHPTAILFLDLNSNIDDRLQTRRSTSKLKSLYCDSCLPLSEGETIESSLRNLQSIFPRLEQFVLVSPNVTRPMNVNLLNVLSNFQELEFVFLKLSGKLIQFSKKNGKLEKIDNNDKARAQFEFEHLNYVMNRRQNFWSSEGDYVGLTRLTSVEKEGFETGHYKFNSGAIQLPHGNFENTFKHPFQIIPPRIQPRLESIEIANVQFKISDIADTTKFCNRLKRLSLVNISSPNLRDHEGVPPNSELPMLEEYYLQAAFIDVWSVLGYHGLKLVGETLFPYVFPWSGEFHGFDIKKNFLESKVKKIHMQHSGDCVGISWNAKTGYLVSAMNHTHEWFKSANQNSNIVIKYFAFIYWELDSEIVPVSIEELNLNFVILKNENIPKLFARIIGLKSLRFVNVRASDNNPADFKTWVWPQVNITQLSINHSKTLKELTFEKVHFKGYTTGVVFENVQTAYFESCKFEVNFLKNFVLVFPNLKSLVITSGSRVDGYILLHAAKLPSLQWILSTRSGVASHVLRQKLQEFLGGEYLKGEEGSVYFIIEKINGQGQNWTQVDIPDNQIKSQMEELKDSKVFGTSSRCHALTFIGGVQKETNITLPQFFQPGN